jgi:HK97 family phage prohead protease
MMLEYLETKAEIDVKSNVQRDESGLEFFSFEGFASAFDVVDIGGDRVKRGAFVKTVEQKGPRIVEGRLRSDIKILYQHNPSTPLGLPEMMKEEDTGLFVRGRIFMSSLGRDVMVALQSKTVDKLSIGYKPILHEIVTIGKDDWGVEKIVRDLIECDLFEFSPVTFPMNMMADITKELNTVGKVHYVGLDLSRELVQSIAKECGVAPSGIKRLYLGTTEEKTKVRVPESKAGKVLSSKNHNLVKEAYDALGKLLELSSFKEGVEPEADEDMGMREDGCDKEMPSGDEDEGMEDDIGMDEEDDDNKSAEVEFQIPRLNFSSWVKSQLEEEKK